VSNATAPDTTALHRAQATTAAMARLNHSRARVYEGVERIAVELERVASVLRTDARRAREGRMVVHDISAERYLVDLTLSAVMGLGPNLRLDALVDRLTTLLTAEAELSQRPAATPPVDAGPSIEELTRYVAHTPDCAKNPRRAAQPNEVACTCGLNELLGLTPTEN
jgi:hypothetical protein